MGIDITIFIGPTISAGQASQYLEADYHPPAEQGDVFAVAKRQPAVIGIVDGYFHRIPSVWHKEVLWALSRGIHVFGSSSMGALRAAELDSFGMVGVGQIYQWYRDRVICDDDEVAVTHAPAELNYLPLSEALVDMRFTLAAAQRQGIVGKRTHDRLLELAKGTFFTRRSYDGMIERGIEDGLPGDELDALVQWLPTGRASLKQADAVAMLSHIRDFADRYPGRKQVPYHVENTFLFDGHAE